MPRFETTPTTSDRVTIGDVASRAGVSVATVSRAMNGRYGVSDATVVRVREVVAEMGYETSLVASSLRNQRTNVIAVLMAGIEPFGSELIKGVARALEGSNFELIVHCGGMSGNDGWERRSVSRLGGTLADGTILVAPTVVDVPTEFPVVAVDPHVGGSKMPVVHAQNFEGARAATNHLIELGHRRIAHLGGRVSLESTSNREAGYRAALDEAGIVHDPLLVQYGDYTEASAEGPARTLLSFADRPTAIFAANDRSALQVMATAAEMGLRVPDDLSVVGFDNVPESLRAEPQLTTVDQSIEALGATAVNLLIDMIEQRPGASGATTRVTLPTELVIRKSTAPPRSSN